ncbi:long-chain-fatty-acid--CoA ligase [Paraburkholderia mimosarum]|uniref:long-chain-fatty-acid--CoA ligase n=1 Tax=Paraburkholderia mimosarum TaxID=312026 RepID=UPI001FC8ABCB|nr:long-chain-fatty-acid--CoA ligase [Paraburkholderia mimosarum]
MSANHGSTQLNGALNRASVLEEPHVNRFANLPSSGASLYSNLDVAATRHPEKIAISYYGCDMTYAELKRKVDALAGFLQQRCGVVRGDRVVLYMQNSPQFIIGFYAIARANAVVVPVNPMNMMGEIRHVVADSGAKVALIGDEVHENARPLLGNILSHIVVARYADYLPEFTDLPLPAVLTREAENVADRSGGPDCEMSGAVQWREALASNCVPSKHVAERNDLAVIPYTSGTTGQPKGCMHTHGSAMHVTRASAQWLSIAQDAVFLCAVPMFHVTGMQLCMNMAILCGATMIVMTRWDAGCAARLIERHRATTWVSIPTMMIDFMSLPELDRFDLSSIVCLCGGGAAMPKAVAQKIESRWGISYIEGYGLSETMSATHFNPPDRVKQQCLGVPIQGVSSLIVDSTTLERTPTGAPGEIVVAGAQVFEGYWKRPDETREAFVEIDERCYLRTGDIGYVDEDGYLFIVDRLKRMINASGFKVWPSEVEAILYSHPAIQEACVVAASDARRGETVKAFVVLRDGCNLSEEQVIAWAREQMASYKVPRVVKFVSALPRSGSGKIQWRLLQQQERDSNDA